MGLSDYDHTLIYFGLSLILYVIACKKVQAVGLAFCVTFGVIAAQVDLLGSLAHFMLPEGANPQILIATLFPASCAILGIMTIFKGQRSLDRIMICATGSSMFLTALVFHVVLIQTILPAWGTDGAWTYSNLVTASTDDFDKLCAHEKIFCKAWPAFQANDIPEVYRKGLVGVNDHYLAYKGQTPKVHGYSVFNDLDDTGVASILYSKSGIETRVVISTAEGLGIHATIKWAFYLLCSIAHSFWLFGSLYLIYFHRKKFNRRTHNSGS